MLPFCLLVFFKEPNSELFLKYRKRFWNVRQVCASCLTELLPIKNKTLLRTLKIYINICFDNAKERITIPKFVMIMIHKETDQLSIFIRINDDQSACLGFVRPNEDTPMRFCIIIAESTTKEYQKSCRYSVWFMMYFPWSRWWAERT